MSKKSAKEVGASIKNARQAVFVTQAELAHRLGVTPQSISAYERGIKKPKIETLERISAALEVNLDFFFKPEKKSTQDSDVRLINANVLRKRIEAQIHDLDQQAEVESAYASSILDDVLDYIDMTPTFDLEKLKPVTKMRIEHNFLGEIYFVCSHCGEGLILEDGTPLENLYKFCPFCGAKIEAEEEVDEQ